MRVACNSPRIGRRAFDQRPDVLRQAIAVSTTGFTNVLGTTFRVEADSEVAYAPQGEGGSARPDTQMTPTQGSGVLLDERNAVL